MKRKSNLLGGKTRVIGLIILALSFSCSTSLYREGMTDLIHYTSKKKLSKVKDKEIDDFLLALWAKRKFELLNSVNTDLIIKHNTVVLYNLQQDLTPLMNWASGKGVDLVLEDICKIFIQTEKGIDEVKKLPIGMGEADYIINYEKTTRLWRHSSGRRNQRYEIILNSSQFLYATSSMINIISKIPKKERSIVMNRFVKVFHKLSLEHYKRWIFAKEGHFQVHGWGCSQKRYNHNQFIKEKRERNFKSKREKSYCNAVTDSDLWIIAGLTEMLSANLNDASTIFIHKEEIRAYKKYLKNGISLIQNRTTYPLLNVDKRQKLMGFNFDIGAWDDHSEYSYSGHFQKEYPKKENKIKSKNVSWDISHASRFIYVFNTLHNNRHLLEVSFPSKEVMTRFSNQFYYKIFNGDFKKPLFNNFLDGKNGWYKLTFSKEKKYGYGPYKLSHSFLYGGYGALRKYNKSIRDVENSVFDWIISGCLKGKSNRYYGKVFLNKEKKLEVNSKYYSHLITFLSTYSNPVYD